MQAADIVDFQRPFALHIIPYECSCMSKREIRRNATAHKPIIITETAAQNRCGCKGITSHNMRF